MAIPIRYSLRNLRVRWRTTLATAAGIALVVFVLAASLMLTAGIRSTLLNAGHRDKALVTSRDADTESDSRLPQSALNLVLAAPGVRRSAEGQAIVSGESLVQLPFTNGSDERQISNVQIRGVTEAAFALRPEVRLVRGRRCRAGTAEAIIGKSLVGRYASLELGASFEIKKDVKVPIVGVFEASGSAYESEIWADLDTLRTSLGWEGYLSSVTAQLESAEAFDAFAATLQSDKRQGLSAERERAYYDRVSQNLSRSIFGLGALVSLIFSFGAVLGAMITMYAAVAQRRKEIGTLLALGFSPSQVLWLFLGESGALALLGTVVGIAIALLTPLADFSTTNVATGQAISFRFALDPPRLALTAIFGIAVGTLGGLFPALRAARMKPTHAMRA